MNQIPRLFFSVRFFTSFGAVGATLCPDGSWTTAPGCTIAPDGSFQPDYGRGTTMAPDGRFIPNTGSTVMCPDDIFILAGHAACFPTAGLLASSEHNLE